MGKHPPLGWMITVFAFTVLRRVQGVRRRRVLFSPLSLSLYADCLSILRIFL